MKKFITMIEDLSVAIAFAEAGIYKPAVMQYSQPICHDSVRIHTA
jgi:hypothetical protein